MTDRVVIIHKVDDYRRWKRHFDAAAHLRKAGGETQFEVLRSVDDPDVVVHIASWSSIADARAFFESTEVQEIRRVAGVESPTFLYLKREESGELPTSDSSDL